MRALWPLGVLMLLAALAASTSTALAQAPQVIGRWDPFAGTGQPYVWPPAFTMHLVRVPGGKTISWFNGAAPPPLPGWPHVQPHLWDPAAPIGQQFTIIQANLPLGCSGHARLPDGSVLIAGGGDPNVSCYPSVNNATKFVSAAPGGWVPVTPMVFARWYPSATTLNDGRILVTSGHMNVTCVTPPPPGPPCPPCPAYFVETPEVYDPTTGTWTLVNANFLQNYYPFMFVNTDGKVFNAGPGTPGDTYMLDVQAQQWTFVAQSYYDPPPPGGTDVVYLSSSFGSAVMYEPGKVLKCGGLTDPPSGQAIGLSAVIDLNVPTPAWNFANPGLMQRPRLNHNAVLLADGSVLLVGGNDTTSDGPAIKPAERWKPADPAQQGWQLMASMEKDRIYHSIACLLADGRVLSTSGDTEFSIPNTAEIYSPPYLFDASGLAPRPQIGFAPSRVNYGQPFTITLSRNSPVPAGQIAKVTLVRLGSVTHGFDMDQRFLLVANLPTVVGDTLNVVAPANGNLAPPGNYMLFIISNTGVPSVAWDILVAP